MRLLGGPLREKRGAGTHEEEQHGGSTKSAEGEASMVMRLVEEISEHRSQGPRQDKGHPEKERS